MFWNKNQTRASAALIAVLFLAFVQLAGAVEVSQVDIENKRCLNCHGQSHIASLAAKDRLSMIATTQPAGMIIAPPTSAPDARPGIFITSESLTRSVHAKIACIDCHADAKGLPHKQKLQPASCGSSCHAKANSEHLQGAHAAAAAKDIANAPTCSTCHGTHEILPKTDRKSHIHPLNIVKICGDCHQKHQPAAGGAPDGKQHIQNYMDSVHGRAVTKGGLSVAATCADCHGNHRVLPAVSEKSTVNRANITDTCGRCHTGVSETFAKSVHGTELEQKGLKPPVCSDCHTSHSISRTDTPAFMLDIVAECGRCHEKPEMLHGRKTSVVETYRRSYHGQTVELGSTRAARCSDCHGGHNVKKIDDSESLLSPANRVATCKKCHAQANEKFAQFESHADYRDGNKYPLLHGVWLYFVIMMSFAFGFFGLHSLFWFFRSIIERIKHGKHHHPAGATAIQRFNRVDRINHAFVIISFFGLTITGLPLLYGDQTWARGLMMALGGVRFAGYLHRFFAIILILNFVVHFYGLAQRVVEHGFKKIFLGPATMLPRVKDVKDCVGMYKWFFLGGKKPRFDRWTYWEKFDYVAEVGGSFIIGFTGLMLWFPQFFANYMPGWMFNVATVVHGYEALLAIGFIFTIHFFNAHLRMEKFPVDDVMFTGRLPEEEFKEERGEEYDRLVAEGKLDSLRVKPAPRWYRIAAVCAGITAMVIGTTLVVLIILAGLKLL